MSEENKNLNTISEETASADSNAAAETAGKTDRKSTRLNSSHT